MHFFQVAEFNGFYLRGFFLNQRNGILSTIENCRSICSLGSIDLDN